MRDDTQACVFYNTEAGTVRVCAWSIDGTRRFEVELEARGGLDVGPLLQAIGLVESMTMPNHRPAVLPCPFCGGVVTTLARHPQRTEAAVSCRGCGAHGPLMDDDREYTLHGPEQAQRAAIRWNRRKRERVSTVTFEDVRTVWLNDERREGGGLSFGDDLG